MHEMQRTCLSPTKGTNATFKAYQASINVGRNVSCIKQQQFVCQQSDCCTNAKTGAATKESQKNEVVVAREFLKEGVDNTPL